MQQLINVIKLVAEKYNDKLNCILSKDMLILEYLYIINNEIDVYKSMEITEFENKLNIEFIPERTNKIISLEELEYIFEILEKRICKKEHTSTEIRDIKDKYVKGTKIKLIKMYDLYGPTPNTMGVIEFVDDKGQVHCQWETGSSLALVVGTDKFEIIHS